METIDKYKLYKSDAEIKVEKYTYKTGAVY